MREQFTENANQALKLAKEAALEFGQGYIGSEHLLLGLLREEQGTAARVLAESGVAEAHLAALIQELIAPEGELLEPKKAA